MSNTNASSYRRSDGENVDSLRAEIDRGRTGSKLPYGDPAAAPLGTDEEAAGTPVSPQTLAAVRDRETANSAAHDAVGADANAAIGNRPGYRLAGAWLLVVVTALALLAALLWIAPPP